MYSALNDLANNERRFRSEPFKFVVDGKPFYVHKDVIARISKPLDRLVNGNMREA